MTATALTSDGEERRLAETIDELVRDDPTARSVVIAVLEQVAQHHARSADKEMEIVGRRGNSHRGDTLAIGRSFGHARDTDYLRGLIATISVESGVTSVRELLNRRSDIELEFVQHRDSGAVHVVVPRDPDRHDEGEVYRIGDVPEKAMRAMAFGEVRTLCGYVARRHLGGFECGDQMVDEFDDDLLCPRCWRALGPEHQARAFQHLQP